MRKTLVSAFGFIIFLMVTAIAWAAPVPDTGVTKCYNNSVEITCPSPGQPFYGQDGNYTIRPMSYTKLDGSGHDQPGSATSWVMVRDNVTGLIWEVKTNKDGVKNYNDPHDADNTYTWYDSNPATNGGFAGTPGTGTDTEDFIKALNDAHYGGYSDWRLPTLNELFSIVNYSIANPGPTIDTGYFPNTQPSWYWSSTTYACSTDRAWSVDFGYGNGYYGSYKSKDGYVRAVREEQSGLLGNLVIGSFDTEDSGSIDAAAAAGSYTDNGDGTVTDTSTGLMWQQTGSYISSWEQALAYCEGLNLGGYTEWRLPTIKELRSLVDYSIPYPGPTINTTYFPNTAASRYWSSTTSTYTTYYAWLVDFGYGDGRYYDKGYAYYVRAVRGGNLLGSLDHSVISVSPTSQAVAKDAGATTFSVSNTGTGTMSWTAAVTSGDTWLWIPPGTSGTDTGTINCSFTANTSTSARTATIRVTAPGATGSPKDVTVIQAPIVCTAILDGNFSLFIPVLSYLDLSLVKTSYWAYFVYEYNPTYPALMLFKLTSAGISTFSCAASTLSGDLKIHIPDLLLPDGITHRSVDMEYSPALSTDVNAYFIVTKIE